MARGASSRFTWVVVLRRPCGTHWLQLYAGDELVARRVFERTRERWGSAVRVDFLGCALALVQPSGKEVERWTVSQHESSGAA